jgi:hypothetical protein
MSDERIIGSINLTLLEDNERNSIVRNLVYNYDEQFKQHGPYVTRIDFSIGYARDIEGKPLPTFGYDVYYQGDQHIANDYITLEHSMRSYLGTELLKRVLTEENPAFKKDCDLEFKDVMNLVYINAMINENVLTKEHVRAYFKEFAKNTIIEKESNYSRCSLGLGLPFGFFKTPLSKTYTTDGTKPSVDPGIIFFLESNRLLKKKSLTPGVNSANKEPLSLDEQDTVKWFSDFLENRENYEKKPKFDIMADMGLTFTERNFNHFKAIFDRNKSTRQDLEMEF